MIYGKVEHYRLVEWESFISLTISLTNITVAPSNLNIRLFVGIWMSLVTPPSFKMIALTNHQI